MATNLELKLARVARATNAVLHFFIDVHYFILFYSFLFFFIFSFLIFEIQNSLCPVFQPTIPSMLNPIHLLPLVVLTTPYPSIHLHQSIPVAYCFLHTTTSFLLFIWYKISCIFIANTPTERPTISLYQFLQDFLQFLT